MDYLHIDIEKSQLTKKTICGDIIKTVRDENSSITILCDGKGSGIKANLAANLCVSRLFELVKRGFSVRQAFENVVKTMEAAKLNDDPYAVFTLIRVLNDGITSVLCYETPEPIFIAKNYAAVLKYRNVTVGKSIIKESGCFLKPGEAICCFSDGVTHSGIGTIGEWGVEGVKSALNEFITRSKSINGSAKDILLEAKVRWGNKIGDDTSIVCLKARKGRVINILTGPPADPKMDSEIARKFLDQEGIKIICGATTAKIIARESGEKLRINDAFESTVTPPNYELNNINLVTEGVITLNQLYNIWGEDSDGLEKENPLVEMISLLTVADKINFWVGTGENTADQDIIFKQTGVLKRSKIVKLIIEKLREDDKTIILKEI